PGPAGSRPRDFRLAMFAAPRPPCDGPAPSPHHTTQRGQGAAAQDNQSPYAHWRIPYRQQFRMVMMRPNYVAIMANQQRLTRTTLFGDPVISGLRDLTRLSLARQSKNVAARLRRSPITRRPRESGGPEAAPGLNSGPLAPRRLSPGARFRRHDERKGRVSNVRFAPAQPETALTSHGDGLRCDHSPGPRQRFRGPLPRC